MMPGKVMVLVGTKKGAFVLESDAGRQSWTLSGPFCETWPMNHVVADPETGTIYGGGGNEWFGPAVWKSTDLGATWTHSSAGLAYPAGRAAHQGRLEHRARPGPSLCRGGASRPVPQRRRGPSWQHVAGLRKHPSRPDWQPGGGGLILHSLVLHPEDDKQIWVGISAAGVFYTADGGETWEARNRGTRADFLPEGRTIPSTANACTRW